MATIKVLYVERADATGVVREIDNHSYQQMSALVTGPAEYGSRGFLESVPLPTGHTMWCNEEAILDGMPLNRVVTAGLGEGKVSLAEMMTGVPLAKTYPARIHGPFFITGPENGSGYSKGLTPRDIEVLAKHLKITVEGVAA